MIGWIDAGAGVSGKMLLGALVDAGVPLELLQAAIDRLDRGLMLRSTICERAGTIATDVEIYGDQDPRLPEFERLIDRIEEPVRSVAGAICRRLVEAESRVKRKPATRVDPGHLRDTLAYAVGSAAGFHHLGLAELHCSPVSLGSAASMSAPVVLELLKGLPVAVGPTTLEGTTPTGAAVLATLVTGWGEMPPLVLGQVGYGAGQGNGPEVANALRIVVGEPFDQEACSVQLETNVDDLDPRVWPYVIERLLAAGAYDAWLTPIIMKKGRPAHTLSVLAPANRARDLRAIIFRETSSIGLRESTVTKHYKLARTEVLIQIGGQPIRIKIARLDGETVNINPEWRDVVAAAQVLGQPAKHVLADARRLAYDEAMKGTVAQSD